jgi:NADPH:quinone reductase-like Zn-dependent oxidoreductase
MPHQAAYIPAKKAQLEVSTAEYTEPGENKITVKNGAVAINPLDWFKQGSGDLFAPWIKYPFIMGSDLAGEVAQVGPGVTRFKVGDRVVAHAVGMDKRSNLSSEGAFQEYTVVQTNLTSHIPDHISYEAACVLPLGLSTASCGLFMKDYLALRHPTNEKLVPVPDKKEAILIWGGSTSVGCNAIQLAIAAGYEVITTAGPHNHALVKKLGAVEAFDYNSPTVIDEIVAAFKDRVSVGAMAIGPKSLAYCVDIVARIKGRKFVAQASVDLPASGFPQGILDWPAFGLQMGISMMSLKTKAKLKRVEVKFIWGSDNMQNEVGKAIYEDYLPQALQDGRFVPAPEPYVLGKGLEHIQEGMDLNRKGVSAKKVVVTL